MPNIAAVLKDEIQRLARKELRFNTESLKKAVSTYRSEIAALKRRVEQLERQQRQTAKRVPAAETLKGAEIDGLHRWRAAGFAQHRKRLGLSAADTGKLLGVSGLTVYKWEGGHRCSILPHRGVPLPKGRRRPRRGVSRDRLLQTCRGTRQTHVGGRQRWPRRRGRAAFHANPRDVPGTQRPASIAQTQAGCALSDRRRLQLAHCHGRNPPTGSERPACGGPGAATNS